ncbi:hypothetical protein MM236_00005, partial [Belliella sp. DSM 107340]|nr:hypothetical protein [Belliella calami]
MKKILLLVLFVGAYIEVSAQVGIGTVDPSRSSQLEIVSSDRGLLIPRVALTSVTDSGTISAGNVESLLVYNTTENGLIVPGYYYWYNDRWRRMAWTGAGEGSNNFVTYNPTTNEFFYTNQDGDLVLIDMGDLFEETVTTMQLVSPGVYSYKNEADVEFIIDVPASVVNQFENIYNEILNESITIEGETYNTFEEYLTTIANQAVNMGDSEFIQVTGSGTESDPYIVSISEGVANSMLITNANGDVEWATIESIVQANETITRIEQNTDGSYTYFNESDVEFIINIPASVVNQFEEIYNQILTEEITVEGNTYTSFEEYLEFIAINAVNIDGGDFITVTGSGTETDPYEITIDGGASNSMLITNANGYVEWATIESIVQANETVTRIEQNTDGSYTYFNESDVEFIINIPASVVNQFEEIYNQILTE